MCKPSISRGLHGLVLFAKSPIVENIVFCLANGAALIGQHLPCYLGLLYRIIKSVVGVLSSYRVMPEHLHSTCISKELNVVLTHKVTLHVYTGEMNNAPTKKVHTVPVYKHIVPL